MENEDRSTSRINVYRGSNHAQRIGWCVRGKWGWYVYSIMEGHMYGPFDELVKGITEVFGLPVHVETEDVPEVRLPLVQKVKQLPEQRIQFPWLSNEPRGF